MGHDCAIQDFFELHKNNFFSKEIHKSFGTLTNNDQQFAFQNWRTLKYVNVVNILNRKS